MAQNIFLLPYSLSLPTFRNYLMSIYFCVRSWARCGGIKAGRGGGSDKPTGSCWKVQRAGVLWPLPNLSSLTLRETNPDSLPLTDTHAKRTPLLKTVETRDEQVFNEIFSA